MEKEIRKARTRNFREIELLIWLILVLLFIVFLFLFHSHRLKSFETHNIFLEDVNGLIVGSPVEYMGVRVGYVSKLKMVSEDLVLVRIIIKDKSIKLPKGTIAKIDSTGLGGSRSLELEPYDEEYVNTYGLNKNADIIVMPTRRMSDTWNLLNEMFLKLSSIIYRVSTFSYLVKTSDVDDDVINTGKNVNIFIDYSMDYIEDIQKKFIDCKKIFNNIQKGYVGKSYE